jgi:hypothetical protein
VVPPALGVAIDDYLADAGVAWVDWMDRPAPPVERHPIR